MSIWLNWLSSCILTPMLEFLDMWYGLSLCQWSRVRAQGANSLLTQTEGNMYCFQHNQGDSALEPYPMSITTKFSQIISILFYTSFYVIFFPPGIIITLCGLLFHLWIAKAFLPLWSNLLA